MPNPESTFAKPCTLFFSAGHRCSVHHGVATRKQNQADAKEHQGQARSSTTRSPLCADKTAQAKQR